MNYMYSILHEQFIFFFNDTATTEIYTYLHTLSLHDALPIYARRWRSLARAREPCARWAKIHARFPRARSEEHTSELQSLMRISYAVFCLKKKKKLYHKIQQVHYNIS